MCRAKLIYSRINGPTDPGLDPLILRSCETCSRRFLFFTILEADSELFSDRISSSLPGILNRYLLQLCSLCRPSRRDSSTWELTDWQRILDSLKIYLRCSTFSLVYTSSSLILKFIIIQVRNVLLIGNKRVVRFGILLRFKIHFSTFSFLDLKI